jgi:hypothetical protein
MASDYKIRVKATDHTKGAFNSVNRSLGKIKGALAGVFAVGVIANFAKTTLQLADNIGKTADSLGLSTRFLQEYQFAAEQSGLTTEEFNKSMMVFSKMVGQASLRTNEVGRTLDKLGISLKNAGGETKSVEAVFLELMRKLGGVENSFERNAILADVFGRAGLKMSVMLGEGSEAMERLAASATGVIDETTIRKAEAFNDAMNVLTRATLLPAQGVVVALANDFIQLGNAMGMIDTDKQVSFLKVELFALKDMLDKAAESTSFLDGAMDNFNNTFADLETGLTPLDAAKERIIEIEALLEELQGKDPLEGVKSTKIQVAALANFHSQLKKVDDTMGNIAVNSMKNFENSIVEGLKTGKFAFEDFAAYVVEQLIRVAIQQLVIKNLLAPFESFFGGFGNMFKTTPTSPPSADGGGFTGMGIRAGGVDGKGGFPAILHPNETVIDHTKGQSMGGNATVNFNISTVDAAGFDQLLASRKGLITSIINNAMNNQGKMGVV